MSDRTSPLRAYTALLAAAFLATTGQAARAAEEVVSAKEYGDDWPYVFDSVRLVCDSAYAVYFEANGVRYALNGTASDAGYEDLSDTDYDNRGRIYRRDPKKLAEADAVFERLADEVGGSEGEFVARKVWKFCLEGRDSGAVSDDYGIILGNYPVNGVTVAVPPVRCPDRWRTGAIRFYSVLRLRGVALCD